MSEQQQPTGITILVVDDSLTDRTLVSGLLVAEQPDWTVLAEPSAAAGLELLSSRPVTAVITDLVMPEMSGEEFLLEVQRQFPSIPVILITAQGSDEIAARSLDLGAVNYVPKRRLGEDLVPAVEEILRSTEEARVAAEVLTHLHHSRTVFHIDPDLEQIRSLLHLIRERLQTMRTLDDLEVRQVTDAVREALMNAYLHGSRNGATGQAGGASSEIEVQLVQDPERIHFAVTDPGCGFDTSKVLEAGSTSVGNGFRIMKQFMDHIEFNERGNCIALTRRLSPVNGS